MIFVGSKGEKSVQGHFIDNSNEHKFLYVPSSSSSKKKNIFEEPWIFIFLDLMWPTVETSANVTEESASYVTSCCD